MIFEEEELENYFRDLSIYSNEEFWILAEDLLEQMIIELKKRRDNLKNDG
ncbi:MAG: hypothetical protein ACTSQJ_00465 [Promethearchaeota archaeon]